MPINSNNYADIRDGLDSEPVVYTAAYWRKQVSILLLELTQEVHALNPGIRLSANLDAIKQYAESTPHMDAVSLMEPTS